MGSFSLIPTEMTSQDMLFHLSVVLFFISSLLVSYAVILHGDKYLENDETSGMSSSSTFMVSSGVVFCSGFLLIVAGCIVGQKHLIYLDCVSKWIRCGKRDTNNKWQKYPYMGGVDERYFLIFKMILYRMRGKKTHHHILKGEYHGF